MKIISFLGDSQYSETTYSMPGKEYTTRFFPSAVAHFFKPDEILICVTPTVLAHKNLADLSADLERRGIKHRTLPIPEGHSESDLWEIFDIITGSVEYGGQVIFDVTLSFRSLPMLTFLVVAYLKAARAVKVERVLYGAWEARDKGTNRSPVFDLSPFVSLLDWLTATNRFVETGDGHALAGLLQQGMPTGIQMGQDLDARQLGSNLKTAAQAIETVSLALRVTRPIETMQAASQLAATLEQALPSVLERARPFSMLAEQVVAEYGQFALEDPTCDDLVDGLRRQRLMIDWYIKRRHVVQATTLAREWVVSTLAYYFKAPVFDYEKGRKEVEQALNNAVERSKPSPNIRVMSRFDDAFEALPSAYQIVKLWSQLTDLRNDIAHVGMRLNPKPANVLKKRIQGLQSHLDDLANLLPAIDPNQETPTS